MKHPTKSGLKIFILLCLTIFITMGCGKETKVEYEETEDEFPEVQVGYYYKDGDPESDQFFIIGENDTVILPLETQAALAELIDEEFIETPTIDKKEYMTGLIERLSKEYNFRKMYQDNGLRLETDDLDGELNDGSDAIMRLGFQYSPEKKIILWHKTEYIFLPEE